MKTIIPDTNVLMAISQFKIDIFSELEKACPSKHQVAILDKTVAELEKIISQQPGKHKQAAKLALAIIKSRKLKEIRTSDGEVDDLLVALSKKPDHIIITQDKELKKRIKEVKGRFLTIRQKKRIV